MTKFTTVFWTGSLFAHLLLVQIAAALDSGSISDASRQESESVRSAQADLLAAADRVLALDGTPAERLTIGGREVVVAVGRVDGAAGKATRIDQDRRQAFSRAIVAAAGELRRGPTGDPAESSSADPVTVRAASVIRLVEDRSAGTIAIAIACWPGGPAAQAASGCGMIADSLAEARRQLSLAIERGELIPIGGTALQLPNGDVFAIGLGCASISSSEKRGNPDATRRRAEMEAQVQAFGSLAGYLDGIEVRGDQQSVTTLQLPGIAQLGCDDAEIDGKSWCWHALAINIAEFERSARLKRELAPRPPRDAPASPQP